MVTMNLLGLFRSNGKKFYQWFEEASQNNHEAALLLDRLCKNFKDPKNTSVKIRHLEHEGDKISHHIYEAINKTFVTPMDREDIIELTQSLDDVMDLINASSSAMVIYNVKKMTPVGAEFSKIIASSTKLIADILPKLRHRRTFPHVDKAIIEINRLENEADDLLHDSMIKLFKNPKNAVDVIRWRDIYTLLEDITDKTEDIANILRNLITKYA